MKRAIKPNVSVDMVRCSNIVKHQKHEEAYMWLSTMEGCREWRRVGGDVDRGELIEDVRIGGGGAKIQNL